MASPRELDWGAAPVSAREFIFISFVVYGADFVWIGYFAYFSLSERRRRLDWVRLPDSPRCSASASGASASSCGPSSGASRGHLCRRMHRHCHLGERFDVFYSESCIAATCSIYFFYNEAFQLL